MWWYRYHAWAAESLCFHIRKLIYADGKHTVRAHTKHVHTYTTSASGIYLLALFQLAMKTGDVNNLGMRVDILWEWSGNEGSLYTGIGISIRCLHPR